MRRIMMTLMTTLACLTCSGQKKHRCMIGMDLTSVLSDKGVCLHGGISVSDRWSAGSSIFLQLPEIGKDPASATHKEDLQIPEREEHERYNDLITAGISAQYWITDIFAGPAISFGVTASHSLDIEFPLSFGYVCRIWKGLGITGFYSLDLLDTVRSARITGKGICISLGYEF